MVLDTGAVAAVKDDLSPVLKIIFGRTRFVRSSLSNAGALSGGVFRQSITEGVAIADTTRFCLLCTTRVVV